MKLYSLLFFALALYTQASAETWIAFRGEGQQENLLGFKDQNGNIKISPTFFVFTRTGRFDEIVSVIDGSQEKHTAYFLNKLGKTFGHSQSYVYDMGTDCENESTIRFRDTKTDTAGIYDKNGGIIIPAIYSDISRMRSGLAIGLKGGSKIKLGEHRLWHDGQSILLNRDHEILIKDFPMSNLHDFSSMQIDNNISNDPTRDSFRGINGKFYNFINNEKAFTTWLNTFIAKDFNQADLATVTYKNIKQFSEEIGWHDTPKNTFLNKNFSILKKHLRALKQPSADFQVSVGELNSLIYDTPEFERYFNNCGEGRITRYPVISVIVNKTTKGGWVQDHFNFLKTPSGFKLVDVTLRSQKLR